MFVEGESRQRNLNIRECVRSSTWVEFSGMENKLKRYKSARL